MLRLSSLCPFCEATALFRPARSTWQIRGAATMPDRRPSRMVLSDRVSRGPRKTVDIGQTMPKNKVNPRNNPWGGTNLTEPPRERYSNKRVISPAEQKRASRYAKAPKGSDKKDPMKALKMQRALANISYEKRSKIKQDLLEHDSFAEFDLLPAVRESVVAQSLGGMTITSPTPIQRITIPALLGTESGKRRSRRRAAEVATTKEMQQFLLAAETGSGKTLAYVLPIIDALKRAEKADAEQERIQQAQQKPEEKVAQSSMFELEPPKMDEPHPTTGRPRAIILVPTSELVVQVGNLIKSVAHTVKFRSAMISAAFTSTVIRSRLFSPGGIDVVISTPHLLNSIADSDPNVLSRVTHLVIDEADSLLDRSFSPITSAIIDRAAPSLEQLIMCSATIPRSLDSYLQKRYPDTRRLVTPNLHAIPRRVQLSVVDIDKVPYQGNRDLACAQTIWDIGKEAAENTDDSQEKKIVVFVNEREKTIELADYLKSKGIDATALSRDSDERKQAEVLAAFTGAGGPSPKIEPKKSSNRSSDAGTPRRALPNTHVLVMTDLGSRGIDTLLVKHVLLYDVPHTSIDFIHRLGRVGRMGRRGRGVVLVGKNDRKDVVREVREGMFKGQALI